MSRACLAVECPFRSLLEVRPVPLGGKVSPRSHGAMPVSRRPGMDSLVVRRTFSRPGALCSAAKPSSTVPKAKEKPREADNKMFRELERVGVVVVDHGSRRKESNEMFEEFVAMFAEQGPYHIVEAAHMELAHPSIHDAFARCVERGAHAVIVSPFFLFPGRHWKSDIPDLAAQASSALGGIPFLVTAPLGQHPLLLQVINDRIEHCLSRVEGSVAECDVCHGTGECVVRQGS
eukprot:jgi/Mesvir1/28711/Mv19682-RA.1